MRPVHRGSCVGVFEYLVRAVAVGAQRRLRDAARQRLPVHAGPILPGDIAVAHAAGFQVIGRPLDKILVGAFLGAAVLIAFVAERAAHGKVGIFRDQVLIDKIPLVHLFRLNWRRRSRSSFSFRCNHGRRLIEKLHGRIAGMADQAIVLTGGNCGG